MSGFGFSLDLVDLSDRIKAGIDFMAAPPYGTVINFAVGIVVALFLVFLIYELNSAKS